MTEFENLDPFLEPDYDSNYWSDDAVLHAEELLNRLPSGDWEKVSEATTIKGYINQGFPGHLSQEVVERLKTLSKVSKISAISYAELIKKFDRGGAVTRPD
jgi:predicted DNA-binding protein